MICEKCGEIINSEAAFCPFCGAKQTQAQQTVQQGEPRSEDNSRLAREQREDRDAFYGNIPSIADTEKNKKPRKKLALTLIICGATIVVLAAAALFAVPAVIKSINTERYEAACALLSDGKYDEASTAFAELEDFENSAEMAERALNEKAYASAAEKFEAGEFADAKTEFEALGDFEDAAQRALLCGDELKYIEATELMEAGEYGAAMQGFAEVQGFKDSDDKQESCRKSLSYNTAREYIDAGEASKAAELLSELTTEDFSDVDELKRVCECMTIYESGKSKLAIDEFYSAYLDFMQITDYSDAEERAQDCIQPIPETGQLYRNDSFGSGVTLKIVPPDDGSSTYIKIYDTSYTLVATLYIRPGKQTKVKLPAGDYIFHTAYSYSGLWFGETDMFGEDAVYQELLATESSSIFSLKRNYIYTLSLRTSKTSGDDVGTKNEDRASF